MLMYAKSIVVANVVWVKVKFTLLVRLPNLDDSERSSSNLILLLQIHVT
jgi:hypothetical protein